MELLKIHLKHLQNEEHIQYNKEFAKLIEKFGACQLKVGRQFQAWSCQYDRENIAFKKVMKSQFTEQIHETDEKRRKIFRRMANLNGVLLGHYTETTKQAAEKLQIVFDNYGNIARKSMIKRTAAITSLLTDFKEHYIHEINITGMAGWIAEMEAANSELITLTAKRDEEKSLRTGIVLQEVRAKVDTCYNSIMERICSLQVVEEGGVYSDFIELLNTKIMKYRTAIAQRKGKSKRRSPKKKKTDS